MAWTRRSNRTAVLKCQSCSHSSLVELKTPGWPFRLLGRAWPEKIRVGARCSNCGARNARLLWRTASSKLLLGWRRKAGATGLARPKGGPGEAAGAVRR
ncbi:MAG: hypothetical protein MI824_20995 [Hyphomicrobiales bacterium]|nr:hypothetical protein [Hyphomicrobiales bacterium]